MGLLLCTATVLGAAGGGILVHYHTVVEQRVGEFFLYTATLRGSSGQWESFNTLPHG